MFNRERQPLFVRSYRATTMQIIRTFIAINVPEEIKEALRELIASAGGHPGNVKWVKADNLHITLKFLGNVTSEQLPQIYEAVEAAAEETEDFQLVTSNTGAFPSFKRPRIFWIGVRHKGTPLISLAANIEQQLLIRGFPKEERRFKPHLTLGRIKEQRRIARVAEAINRYSFPNISFQVSGIDVMKSQLTPRGPIYTSLKTIPLNSAE